MLVCWCLGLDYFHLWDVFWVSADLGRQTLRTTSTRLTFVTKVYWGNDKITFTNRQRFLLLLTSLSSLESCLENQMHDFAENALPLCLHLMGWEGMERRACLISQHVWPFQSKYTWLGIDGEMPSCLCKDESLLVSICWQINNLTTCEVSHLFSRIKLSCVLLLLQMLGSNVAGALKLRMTVSFGEGLFFYRQHCGGSVNNHPPICSCLHCQWWRRAAKS